MNFLLLDGDVPRPIFYVVYNSIIPSSRVDDLNTSKKLLKQGYRYHKLRMAFSNFYGRHFDLVPKCNVELQTLLLQSLSEPEFYGDLAT